MGQKFGFPLSREAILPQVKPNLVPRFKDQSFASLIGIVPSRPRELTKVKVNIWWDPSGGPNEESQHVDRLGRRLV